MPEFWVTPITDTADNRYQYPILQLHEDAPCQLRFSMWTNTS